MQKYHSNALTNVYIRQQIKNNFLEKNKDLAKKYGVSLQTVSKWKSRQDLEDRSSKPHNIRYAINEELQNLAVSIRKSSWLPLDVIHEMILQYQSNISRASLYRVFKRNGINTLPQQEREKVNKFKEYSVGYLHIDVTYLPKIDGVKSYLFVAIDRATRLLYFKVYDKKNGENAQHFFDECMNFFPFKITTILTDNGLEFSNKLLKSKKGNHCTKKSLFDLKCEQYNINHRLTKPSTPKTNGMVERVNGIIKSTTILKHDYSNLEEMKQELNKYLVYYNTIRRHGGLVKELKVKTPLEAVYMWQKLNNSCFIEKVSDFEKKCIDLSYSFKQRRGT